MSNKPCGCGNAQVERASVTDDATKPTIVPLPPELRERNRIARATIQEPLPDYLTDMLVAVPENEEGK